MTLILSSVNSFDSIKMSTFSSLQKLYIYSTDIDLEGFKEILHEIDPNEIILLDISSVGTEGGFNKELLHIFSDFKDKIILGGGITPDEIDEISNMGIKKALVGTALHKGEIRINEF